MKALIAEDDLYTRQALITIMQSDGWEVLACGDGKNALSNFASGGFDLVCLDIMMPQLSGYDVCREIRRIDSAVPILFISAKSEEIDTVLGLELGADDFIVKPFGVRELQARIRAVLRRSQATQNTTAPEDSPAGAVTDLPAFDFGHWEIRPAELRACPRSSAPAALATRIELSRREIAMLSLLASRPGQVISREAFFRHCWQLEQAPLSRTLDQHIARLRKKIESVDQPQLILTVQGIGYRYQAPIEQ